MTVLGFLNPLSKDFLGGVLEPDDENQPTWYDPRADYADGGLIKGDAYAPVGVADWERERRQALAESANAEAARLGGDEALGMLARRAGGAVPSIAQLAADQQRRGMISAAASQAASGLGSYSPARQRAAAFGLSAGLGQLGGATATAVAAEQQRAEAAYEAARRQRYAQELAAEQSRRAQSLGLLGMKSNEAQGNRQSAIQENQDRINMSARQQATQAGVMASKDAQGTAQDVALLNAAASAFSPAPKK